MCKDCQAARAYQNSARSYDDEHPADKVAGALHKWKFYTREIWLRSHSFDALLIEAHQALRAVCAARESLALAAAPTIDAQKAVYAAFERVDQHYEHGVIMLGLTAGEALDDALQGLSKLTGMRRPRDAARSARLQQREQLVDAAISAFRRQVANESEALKAALPDYDKIAPRFTVISEAGW